MTPLEPIVEALVCRLDDNLREAFEERAGILQFEAGRSRELAEPLALLDVVRMHPLAVAGVVCMSGTVAGAPVHVIAADEASAGAALAALGVAGTARTDLSRVVASLGGTARLMGGREVLPKE
ncbi:hypothetical protein [Ramlibacter albus]|uniref:Uncharacterized protein n=1 Tax=Ramlibacter albus TaxID=2079448 RepID=A0A923MDG6_9BURK|nr:hypothetical protein [Ramlibacter albus]MBC5768690.1 hypothetical protein [Ramlibacter albus]